MAPLAYHLSDSDEWETPPDLFALLHREFDFTVDAAASLANTQLPRFWTIREDGLAQDWSAERVFVNPPYSQAQQWIEKAVHEARRGSLVVMLVGARTGTRYWAEWVYPWTNEIRFLIGRVQFLRQGHQVKGSTFDSAALVYRRKVQAAPTSIYPWDWRAEIGQKANTLREAV